MDQMKFLEVKKQMDENNEDLRDFLSDIDRWRSDMKSKTSRISKSNPSDIDLPCVRNSLSKKKKKKHESITNKEPKSCLRTNKDKIKSYDYNSWDKFDVEKALEEIDKETETKPSSESGTDDDWEDERRIKLSELEKEQGNIRFKDGNFDAAIEHYTTAIRLAPENPVLYSNRALALIKSDRFASAEADCTTALAIDPKFVKALYRRSQSRRNLDKIEDAISDLKYIIEIEPKNKSAINDLRNLVPDADINLNAANPPHSLYTLIDSSDLLSLSMRRIPIVEVGSSLTSKRNNYERISKTIPEVISVHKEDFDSTVNSLKIISNADLAPISFAAGDQNQSSVPSRKSTLSSPSPTNWFQMERELREFSGRSSGRTLCPQAVEYLCSIDPAKYASIVGQNLDSSCLSKFLTAISSNSTLSPFCKAKCLLALVKLPRFDVAWMLIDDKERSMVSRLVSELKPCLDSDSFISITNAFI